MIHVFTPKPLDEQTDYREFLFTADDRIARIYSNNTDPERYGNHIVMTEEQFTRFQRRLHDDDNIDADFEELFEVERGIVMTQNSYEFMTDALYDDIENLYVQFKKMRRVLKFFKGKDYRKLDKAIKKVYRDFESMSGFGGDIKIRKVVKTYMDGDSIC